jgi:putative transposase
MTTAATRAYVRLDHPAGDADSVVGCDVGTRGSGESRLGCAWHEERLAPVERWSEEMPRLRSAAITLSGEQEQELERLARAHSTPQKLAERARIILMASQGTGVRATARRLGVWPKTVRQWRKRWLGCQQEARLVERLADAPRPGAPATFTPEQICAIVALACEAPAASGLPLTHWSQSELAREAVRRGIVESISHSTVGAFLKGGRAAAASGSPVADAQAGSPVRAKERRYLCGVPHGAEPSAGRAGRGAHHLD